MAKWSSSRSLWRQLVSWLLSHMSSLWNKNGFSLVFAAVAAVALLVSLRNRKRRNTQQTSAVSNEAVNETFCFEYSVGNKSSVSSGSYATTTRNTGGRLKSIFRGVTRVTLGTDLEKSCIFRRVSSLGEGEKVQIDPDKLHGLMQLLSLFEVFLIIRVHDDEEEVNCRKALELAGTLQCGLHPAKVLFCETLQGTTAIVRQLEPQMHIDSNPSVIVDLERFIQRLVYIGSSACSSSSRTNRPIVSLEKLEDIFL